MKHFIIGTAGHIDHGKTSLVEALTGIDTDRLQEEKERGITIDIGFAYWTNGITIIDVPGHERFIRNMVAGVSAIDFALLVIAADDGIMPQTEEHVEILKLLHIPTGAVVITKTDLVDELQLNALEAEIKGFLSGSFLSHAPVFRVSSIQNSGVETLSRYLQDFALQFLPKTDRGFFRMNIDRSFSVKGFGSVLTGTVLSGTVRVDQAVEILPERKKVRIRGLQKHTQPVDELKSGARAAVNISGLDKEVIRRGHVLAEPGYLVPKIKIFAKLYLLKTLRKPLNKPMRARLYIGTAAIFSKLKLTSEPILPGASGYVEITTETPIVCVRGDRFIIREVNASATLGGGSVLDHFESGTDPDIHYLADMEKGDISFCLGRFIEHHKIVPVIDTVSVFGLSMDFVEKELEALKKSNRIAIMDEHKEIAVSRAYLTKLQNEMLGAISLFHQEHPSEKGIKTSELKMRFSRIANDAVFDNVLRQLLEAGLAKEENETVSLFAHRIQLTTKEAKIIEGIESRLYQDRFSPPSIETVAQEMNLSPVQLRQALKTMLQLKKIIKTDENLYFHAEAVREARQFVIDFINEKGHIKITDFKNRFHTSRKFALSLLEYFDTIQVTFRNGDIRVLHQTTDGG